ncbi:MAG TPA: hypothetical protein VFB42_14720 [Gaiellaceae bacterium]|nr:hypothetical protein [Gaiellaceae bacterium]
MKKTIAIVLATACVCFGVAAAAGFARSSGRQFNLEVGDRSVFKPANIQCQVLTKTQVVCGGLKVQNAVTVYYSPTQLAVVKVQSRKKGTLLYATKR